MKAFNKSMTMTVELLERYVKSEVENLHFRIDQLAEYIERIDQRLERVERQITLLINWVDDLKVRVAWLEENMLTKEDAQDFITKDDLAAFGQEIKQFITQALKTTPKAG